MFFSLVFFINNQSKQRKMLHITYIYIKQLHIHCYSNQVKKQFHPFNSVLVLTVNVRAKHTARVA